MSNAPTQVLRSLRHTVPVRDSTRRSLVSQGHITNPSLDRYEWILGHISTPLQILKLSTTTRTPAPTFTEQLQQPQTMETTQYNQMMVSVSSIQSGGMKSCFNTLRL